MISFLKFECIYIPILFWLIVELPRPELGDLSDLAPERTTSLTQLGLRYPDICQFDTIEVDLVPEKKGLFLKHVEYQVSSKVMYTIADLCVFQDNRGESLVWEDSINRVFVTSSSMALRSVFSPWPPRFSSSIWS